MAAEFKIGRLRYNWAGTWTTATEYGRDDVILNDGKAYFCLIPHTASANFYTDLYATFPKWKQMLDGKTWAGPWETSHSYGVGHIVVFGGNAYTSIVAHTSTTFAADAANWEVYTESNKWNPVWQANTAYGLNDIVRWGGIVYKCIANHTSAASTTLGLEANQASWEVYYSGIDFKGDWTSSQRYKLNDIVKLNGSLYRCTQYHTSSSTFADNNFVVWVPGQLANIMWSSATTYQIGDAVIYGGDAYISKTSNNSNNFPDTDIINWGPFNIGYTVRNNWSSTTPYAPGDLVSRNGVLYEAVARSTGQDPNTSTTNTTYISAGSSGNTITVLSGAGIVSGMTVSGTGISNGQRVSTVTTTSASVTTATISGPPAITVSSFTSKTGSGPYLVTFAIPSQSIAPPINTNYVVAGNSNNSYNGTYTCTASTTTSITLSYVTDPGVYGSGTTTLTAQAGTTLTLTGTVTGTFAPGMLLNGSGIPNGVYIVSGAGTSWEISSPLSVTSIVISGTLTSIVLTSPPNSTVPDNTTFNFLGINSAYWSVLISGKKWCNRWVQGTLYSVGDVVAYSNGVYVCVNQHQDPSTPSATFQPGNSTSGNWILLISSDLNNALNSQGDLRTFANNKPSAVAIGTDTYLLSVNSDIPNWRKINVVPAVYYVDAYSGIDTPGYGITWDQPWRSIKYACDTISTGFYFPNAVTLLKANKAYVIAEMYQWMLYQMANNIAPFSSDSLWNPTKAQRDASLIFDAIVYDLKRGGNSQSVNAALSFFYYGSQTQLVNSIVKSTLPYYVPALNYLVTLMQSVVANTNLVNYQLLNNVPLVSRVNQVVINSLVAESGINTNISSLMSIITTALTNENTYLVPTANTGIQASIYVKTGTYNELLPISVPENVSIIGDELRSAVVQPSISKTFYCTQTIAPNSNQITTNTMVVNSTVGLVDQMRLQFISPFINNAPTTFGGVTSGKTYYVDGSSITSTSLRIKDGPTFDFTGTTTLGSNILTNVSNITNLSVGMKITGNGIPADTYVYSFSQAVNSISSVTMCSGYPLATNYVFVESNATVTGILQTFTASGNYVEFTNGSGNMTVYAGDCLKDMFYVRNGVTIRNLSLFGLKGTLTAANQYLTCRPTGGAYTSLDPGTGPNDTSVWIIKRSPYVQNVTTFGDGCVGMKVDGYLHNGGSKSMVTNDYTQVVSDGIGVWIKGPGSIAECISVFCYYGYAGYFAEDGGRIRAANGNSSYGTFGVVSEGYDNTEVPLTGTINNQSQQVQASVTSAFGTVDQLLKLNYSNAGSQYYYPVTNMLKRSNDFLTTWTNDGFISFIKNNTAPTGYTEAWLLTGSSNTPGSGWIQQSININPSGATYTNVGGTTQDGAPGNSATFDITVTSTTYVVTVNTPGTLYQTGNNIVIKGSVLGGLDTVNDLTIVVGNLAGTGISTIASTSGTIPAGSNQNYTLSMYVYDTGTSATLDIQAVFSGTTTVTSGISYNIASKTVTPYSGTSLTNSANGGTLPVNFKAQKTLVAGWYRVWFSVNDSTGVNNTLTFKFFPQGANAPVSNTYSIVYGAQVEISDTDYTPKFYLETTTNQFTAYANYQVVGAGAGASLSGDEIRSQSVFNARVTTDSNGFTGGAGYGNSANTAADGNTYSIRLAATDQGIYNYLGMRAFISAGTGAGQYGFVTYYNNSSGVDANGITSKTALIAKETIDPVNVVSTTYNATPANNLITLSSGSDTSQWYVNQAVQFVPTYYTTTVTSTSTDTVVATSSIGGTTNTISIPTASLALNMPVTFGTGDLNLSPGFQYYITQIDYDNDTIQIATSISGTAIQLTTVASTSQTMTFPRYSGYIKAPTTNMVPNINIQFTGVSLGGVALGTTYYINDIVDANNFTISTNRVSLTSTSSVGGSTNTVAANTVSLVPCNPVVFSGTIFDAAISPGVTYYISNIVDAGNFNITTEIIRVDVTSTTFGTNLVEVSDTTGFVIGQPIIFSGIASGTTFGNIQPETTYYILTINTVNNTITISTDKINTFVLTTRAGLVQARTCPEPLSLGGGTGSMTVTSTGTKLVVTNSVGNISTMNGTFSTSLYGGLNSYTLYYITAITEGTNPTLSVSTTQAGTPITLTTGVGNMQMVASGWDHINPGTVIVAPDSTSSYFIEPKVTFTSPANGQAVGTVATALTGGATFTSIASGNNAWIALPTSGSTGATSTDGSSWSAITLPSTITSWSDVAYGNNYWIAVGKTSAGASTAAYSNSNGLGWKTVTLPSTSNYNKIVYGNGTFVMISSDSHRAAYSTNNGLTWTQSYLPSSTAVTVSGDAKISSSQSKFGISSLALDGTGDYITVASDSKFAYGNEDFTIEFFVYPNSLTGTQALFDQRSVANDAAVYLDLTSGGAVRLFVNNSYQITAGTTISAGAWSHIALSRVNGTTTMYINGTAQSTTYTDANAYAARPIVIGSNISTNSFFNGYIDEVRVSRGIGRYTGAFTPTTVEFTSDSNTMLLMHFNGLNNSTNIASTIGTWVSIAYGNGVFVAINSNGQTGWSVDGITWNSSTAPTSNTTLSGVTILGGGGTFSCTTTTTQLVVGQSVVITGLNSGTGSVKNGIYYISSTNGKSTFTLSANLANALAGTNPISTSAGTPVGLTFAVGGPAYTGIAYGNNKFVAVQSGYGLKAGISFDGVNWIQSLTYMTATSVNYGQGVFLALNSSSTTAYSSEHGLSWRTRTLTYGSINSCEFGFNASNVGCFVTLTGSGISTGNATLINEGCRAQGRPTLNSGVINAVTLWESGSNYTSTPTVVFTDYNVSVTATVTPRISNGTLSNPTFINRGTGYNTTSTVVSVNGDGFADTFQTGLTIIVNNLASVPIVGSNMQIEGNSQVYKVTSASAVFGTTAPFIQANIQLSPEMTNALSPEHNTAVSFRQLYSQCRLTNHDFLLIGTGNKAQTNYPFTDTETAKIQNQAVETNQGHVFYTSTDENGNFSVGGLFGVQQATGTVTLSATQFGLTGLQTLSLGGIAVGSSSVVVNQFSTDPTFSGNSDTIIPTQRAIRSYLTGRLSQGGANTYTGNFIAGTVSVGGPNFIKSTVTNGQVGSAIQMKNKVYFVGNGVDGGIPAFNMFMKHATKRGNA